MRAGFILSLAVLLFATTAGLLVGSGSALFAQAGAPQNQSEAQAAAGTAFVYQGRLQSNGAAASGSFELRFSLFDAAQAGKPIGNPLTLPSVTPAANGLFAVRLDFGAGIFSGPARFLQIELRPAGSNDAFTPLSPRQELTPAPYALYSAGAPWSGLTGMPGGFADGVDNTGEIDPSTTQARVIGSCPAGKSIRAIASDGTVTCETDDIGTGGASGDGDTLGDLDCATDQIALYTGSAWICSNQLKDLLTRVTALETKLAHVSNSEDGKQIYITSANLHIRSGSGATTAAVNGLGNLIIGYNEVRASGVTTRTGSHMLVVGIENAYSSFGGIVVGQQNETKAPYASVSGGFQNIASGSAAAVSGGTANRATADYASVSGGIRNKANGGAAWVGGGSDNIASGLVAAVSGGQSNIAGGDYAAVSGGYLNNAGGHAAAVSGGQSNKASGDYAAVSGGQINTASGLSAAVSSGSRNQAIGNDASVSGGFGNKANGVFSSIIGGDTNIADGESATISGGDFNSAGGKWASVSGGDHNTASGESAAVSGGHGNTASAKWASVNGGSSNTASGVGATVSGGDTGTASGTADWVAGGLFQDD